MSRWLGFSTSSSRDQAQAETNVVMHHSASNVDNGSSNGAGKTHQNRNREETDVELESTGSRSSQVSEVSKVAISNSGNDDSSVIIRPIRTMTSPGLAGTGDDLEDWEEIMPEHVEHLCLRQPHERERPLSPGVDFSEWDGKPLGLEGESVSEGSAHEQGSTGGSKWIDARDSHSFLVRGPTYLEDKGKRPAGTAMCRLVGFDCFAVTSPGVTRIDHIASRGLCHDKVGAFTSGLDSPFLFIMNIQVRGSPPVSMVAYWAIDSKALDNPDAVKDPEQKMFAKIVASYADIPLSQFAGGRGRDDRSCPLMDDQPPPPHSDERNRRFKLIPRVLEGPWMVRKAVGSTPVLLGTKIHHSYPSSHSTLPVASINDCHDANTYGTTEERDMWRRTWTRDHPAASLCGRCRGLSRNLDVDLGIVLQANAAEELPEVLLGAVTLKGFGVEDPTLQTRLFP